MAEAMLDVAGAFIKRHCFVAWRLPCGGIRVCKAMHELLIQLGGKL